MSMAANGWAPRGARRGLWSETSGGNPFVGAQLLDLVILHDGFGKADHLENHECPGRARARRPAFHLGRVIFLIEAEAVLVDELVLPPRCDPVVPGGSS